MDGRPDHVDITEGLATIRVPKGSKTAEDVQGVFYNPIQQFNRDLSVLVIQEFARTVGSLRRDRNQRTRAKKAAKKRKRDEAAEQPGPATEPHDGEKEAPQPEEATASEAAVQVGSASAEQVGASRGGPKAIFTILDALSATGLRAIRYAKEIAAATSVTANDLSPAATRSIQENVLLNGVDDTVKTTTGNALALMYATAFATGQRKFDVIDLDPYGSAAPFLDAAVQALNDGGLLCATFTDSAVWASTGYSEKTFALYGGVPVRGIYSHEVGLRLILNAVATSAARYGLAIEPLLSLSADYYVRVFVRVWHSPAQVKFLAGKTMLLYACDHGCGAWTTQLLFNNREKLSRKGGKIYKHCVTQAPSAPPSCEHCGFKTHLAGPMYAGPIHSTPFVKNILEGLSSLDRETYGTYQRIEGVLTTVVEEDLTVEHLGPNKRQKKREQDSSKFSEGQPTSVGEPDAAEAASPPAFDPARIDEHPFYLVPNALAGIMHCKVPTENAFRGALMHLGYRVTRSHAKAGSVKTNAPWSIIWHVMREWVRQYAPVKESSIKEGTVAWALLKNKGESQKDGADGADPTNTSPTNDVVVNFDEALGAGEKTGRRRLRRYQQNPRPNWGPMSRAKASTAKGEGEAVDAIPADIASGDHEGDDGDDHQEEGTISTAANTNDHYQGDDGEGHDETMADTTDDDHVHRGDDGEGLQESAVNHDDGAEYDHQGDAGEDHREVTVYVNDGADQDAQAYEGGEEYCDCEGCEDREGCYDECESCYNEGEGYYDDGQECYDDAEQQQHDNVEQQYDNAEQHCDNVEQHYVDGEQHHDDGEGHYNGGEDGVHYNDGEDGVHYNEGEGEDHYDNGEGYYNIWEGDYDDGEGYYDDKDESPVSAS